MTESSEARPTPSPTPRSEPTLLLLHGLGATAGVWADLVSELEWPGRVIAPDLAGHGRAPFGLATMPWSLWPAASPAS